MNTAERVVEILDTLASSAGSCGVSEISRQLGLGKNNVFRILSALESKGWVHQDVETRRYSLTGAMARVALQSLSQLDIQRVSLPFLDELQAITGETSALSIRVDFERMFISSVPSHHEVRQMVPLGERRQMWYGSGGRAILAFMAEEEIGAVLRQFEASGVSVLAGGQAVTIDSLRQELAQVRSQGFSAAAGERTSGICGVSAPIFNHEQKVVGSLSVSGPMPRFDLDKACQHGPLVLDRAKKISSILGASIA